MPTTFMYKYTDMVDFTIRKYIARKLWTECEFLKHMGLSGGTFAKCRKHGKISRPLIAKLTAEGIDFKGIKFELYEGDKG